MASCFGAGLLYGAMGRASQGQGGLAESGVIAESNMARAANVESFGISSLAFNQRCGQCRERGTIVPTRLSGLKEL
jgi:hypothetical protein